MQDSTIPKRVKPHQNKVVDMITSERAKREKGWRCPKCGGKFIDKLDQATHWKLSPKCAENE